MRSGVVQYCVVVACLPFRQAVLKAAIPEQEHSGSTVVLLMTVAGMVKRRVLQELPVERQNHSVAEGHTGLLQAQERTDLVPRDHCLLGAAMSYGEGPEEDPSGEVVE